MNEATLSPGASNPWRPLLGLIFGSALMAWLLSRFGVDPALAALRGVRLNFLALYLFLALLILLASSGRSWLIARSSEKTPPAFARFVGARLAGDAAGSLLPGGRVSGDPLRIAMLYGDGVSGVRASSWILVDRIMETAGNAIAAMVYVMFLSLHRVADAAAPALGVMLLGLLALALMIVLLWSGKRPLSPLVAQLTRFVPRWHTQVGWVHDLEDQLQIFFQHHTRVFIGGLLLSLLIEASIVVEYGALFRAFGLDLDPATLMLALLATGMARGLPTPAGIGALEGAQVAALTYGMGRPDLGFVAGVVLRLHETLWMTIGAVVLVGSRGGRRRRRRGGVPQHVDHLSNAAPIDSGAPR